MSQLGLVPRKPLDTKVPCNTKPVFDFILFIVCHYLHFLVLLAFGG